MCGGIRGVRHAAGAAPGRAQMTAATSLLGRPVGANGEETRQRILIAAMRCVAEVGYSKTSIREIAQAAEMTSAQPLSLLP